MAACGLSHTITMDMNGNVYGFGGNNFQQISYEYKPLMEIGPYANQINAQHYDTKYIPKRITAFNNVIQIACGENYTACVTSFGELWTFGCNSAGQLGNGKITNQNKPQLVENNIISVACGYDHTLCITNENKVLGTGDNRTGNPLGLDEKKIYKKFTELPILTDIQKVACLKQSSIFLDKNGNVYVCGNNNYGQLGLERKSVNESYPITKLSDVEDVISIACGQFHSLFLKSDGTVYSCGYNLNGQLGRKIIEDQKVYTAQNYCSTIAQIEYLANDIQAIFCGPENSFCLSFDQILWGFGSNEFGQLGSNNNDKLSLPSIIPIDGVNDVACGPRHTLFRTPNCIYGCGSNQDGKLGFGSYDHFSIINGKDGLIVFALPGNSESNPITEVFCPTKLGGNKHAEKYSLFWGERKVWKKSARK